ncbi:MAG: hypothetical protein PHU77_04820 [Simplicispira sp.]|nr:hypothetical protein [Simplicispira sp.]
MSTGRRALTGWWLALLLSAGGHAQSVPAPSGAPQSPAVSGTAVGAAQERARIHQERQAIARALQQSQTACYQRFAVEDCLQKARRTARQSDASLRQREAVLDATERRERAAQRLAVIAEHEKSLPAPMPAVSAVQDTTPLATVRPERQERTRVLQSPDKSAVLHHREREVQAQARARQQQEKRRAYQASQADAIASQAARAARARQLQEEKKATAAQRKARVLQSQMDHAAAGRKPAAPLSPEP